MGSMLSSSQAHAVQAADWTDPMYKTPRQPLDSIERLLSNSLQMKVPQVPQSTFHLIKSSITLFTDDDTDSSDISDAHASPIPPEDALAQLKTTDSVYSESSDSSLMEPRVIIFGETDQELPIQPEIESHITRHIYKSPDETSFHKIWECIKASLTRERLYIAYCVLIVLIIVVAECFSVRDCLKIAFPETARVKYSRVPVSNFIVQCHT